MTTTSSESRETFEESAAREPAWPHLAALAASLAVLLAAALLSVRGESQVVLPLLNIPLPETCSWKRLFGFGCPGCGLTRCFVSMAHCQVGRAWHFNPAGVLLFIALAFQVPFRAAQSWRAARGARLLRIPGLLWLVWAFLALLLGQWVWRIVA